MSTPEQEQEQERFFQIDFMYKDPAFWRGPAKSPEDAEEQLRKFAEGQNLQITDIIQIKEVETALPEEHEMTPNRGTLN